MPAESWCWVKPSANAVRYRVERAEYVDAPLSVRPPQSVGNAFVPIGDPRGLVRLEEALAELVQEGNMPFPRPVQDNTVGMLDQLAIFAFTLA